jgi:hypothetical protein
MTRTKSWALNLARMRWERRWNSARKCDEPNSREADDSWDAAWQATSEAIREVFDTNVQEPCVWQRVNNETEIAAWIAPGRDCSGMIETLCLQAVRSENSDTFFCLEQFAACLHERHAGDLHEKEKFAIWSIAAQVKDAPRQRLSIPRAISNLNIDWNSPVFAELAAVLRSIVNDAAGPEDVAS